MGRSEKDRDGLSAALAASAGSLGIELDDEQLRLFAVYYEILVDWNRRLNLTRIVEPRDVAIKHFLDSLTCLLVMPPAARKVIDVGTGAGLPGVPIKIGRPGLRLTLLESVAKKTAFLEHLVARLGLTDVAVVHGRAEDIARLPGHRAAYDVALARAVAPLATLVEYCLPFVKIGGRMIAQKTAGIEEELQVAGRAIVVLGGRVIEARPVSLPDLDVPRLLVVIEKVRDTPQIYPRQAGLPAKKPLA